MSRSLPRRIGGRAVDIPEWMWRSINRQNYYRSMKVGRSRLHHELHLGEEEFHDTYTGRRLDYTSRAAKYGAEEETRYSAKTLRRKPKHQRKRKERRHWATIQVDVEYESILTGRWIIKWPKGLSK